MAALFLTFISKGTFLCPPRPEATEESSPLYPLTGHLAHPAAAPWQTTPARGTPLTAEHVEQNLRAPRPLQPGIRRGGGPL